MIGSCMVLDKQHVIMVNTCGIVGMRGVGRCIYQGIVIVESRKHTIFDAWVNFIQPVVD
jgi:hypothetical protein